MNKTQLIDAIAADAGLPKVEAKKALDAFMKITVDQLKQGDKLTLVGFGTFSVIERSARLGRNPSTGQTLEIASKKTVKFKAGNGFLEDVR